MNRRLRCVLAAVIGATFVGAVLVVAAPEIVTPVAAAPVTESHSEPNSQAGDLPIRIFRCNDGTCPSCNVPSSFGDYTEVLPTGGGLFAGYAERTLAGCCSDQLWRICERNPLVPYTGTIRIEVTNVGAFQVYGQSGLPYLGTVVHCELKQSSGVKQCEESFQRLTGDDVSAGGNVKAHFDGIGEVLWELELTGWMTPPVNYCEDGIEALNISPLALDPADMFGLTVNTGLESQAVRYIIEAAEAWAGKGSINYATRSFSNTVGGIYTVTVPALHGVAGPLADLLYENTGGSTVNLLSACVITATTPDYCPNGIEFISDTVTLNSGQGWTGETTTEWDRLYTKFTFEYPPDEDGVNYYEADLTVNNTTLERGWMRATSGDNDTHTELVPNLDDPTEYDFMEPPYEDGPDVQVAVDATGNTNPLHLVSACVLEIADVNWCTDGVELLDNPVGLGDLSINDRVQVSGTITGTDIVARFVVEDPAYPVQSDMSAQVRFTTGLGGAYKQTHFIDFTSELWFPSRYITATLPNTGTLRLFSSGLDVVYQNLQDSAILHSICIVGAEDLAEERITSDRCMLYNPDFEVDVGGADNWTPSGSVAWSHGLDFDGIVTLNSMGQVTQTALIQQGDVFELEVKARSVGGSQYMEWGSPTTSFMTSGPQVYEATVEPLTSWWVVQRDVYLSGPDSGAPSAVMVSGDGIEVDYVCLGEDAGVFPDVECILPPWDPPENEGILSGQFWHYVWEHIRSVLLYGLCELLRGINAVQTFVRDTLMVVPAFPDPGSGVISWLEWIGLLIGRFGDYLGRNLLNIARWFPRNGDTAARWLLRVVTEILTWFLGLFGLDATWLAEMRDVIWSDGAVFLDAVRTEIELEFAALVRLIEDTVDVFIILINGFSGGVSGTEIAPIGKDLSGVAEFIWKGFDFFNTAIQDTPLIALNILALGILAFGLGQWTLQKLLSMLESLAF